MKISTPFFIVNPKNYLSYSEIKKLAIHTNKLAEELEISVFFTGPSSYLETLSEENESLIITAQDISVYDHKDTMGKISFRNLQEINTKAVVLNHGESPLSISEVITGIDQANKNKIISIVCANSVAEAKMIALCNPTIILAEEVQLIGGETTSDSDFLEEVIREVKAINPSILVEYGAGIRTAEDVSRLLDTGVDGVGVTSGIVKAEEPLKMVEKMLNVVKIKSQRR